MSDKFHKQNKLSHYDWLIDWLSKAERPTKHIIGHIGPFYRGRIFTGQMTQPSVSKHWRNTQN